MNNFILQNVITPILGIIATGIGAIIVGEVKKFVAKHNYKVDQELELIKSKIGEAQYNRDMQEVQKAILSVEQMAKEFDWDSAIKHSKATEYIASHTNLTNEEIYTSIKAIISQFNMHKTADDYKEGTNIIDPTLTAPSDLQSPESQEGTSAQ